MFRLQTIARPAVILLLMCCTAACAGDHPDQSQQRAPAESTATASTATPAPGPQLATTPSAATPSAETQTAAPPDATRQGTVFHDGLTAGTNWQLASRGRGTARIAAGVESGEINASAFARTSEVNAAREKELAAFDETPPAPPWAGTGGKDSLIPVCPGLTIVTAVASQGDYESIKTIESVTPTAYRLRYSAEVSQPWWMTLTPKMTRTVTHRTVLMADVASAHRYHHVFTTTAAATETAAGSTAIGTSTSVLRALKRDGQATLALCDSAGDNMMVDDSGQIVPVAGGCSSFTAPFVIKRVDAAPIPFDVLVDGVPTQLPAVRARGTGFSAAYDGVNRTEFLFLDDERNPLTLRFRLGIGAVWVLSPTTRAACEAARRRETTVWGDANCDLPDGGDRNTLRVVKIDTRCQAPDLTAAAGTGSGAGAGGAGGGGQGGGLEQALAESGTVDVYSIYFSFNSDAIREESEPTLKEIAGILTRRADWKLGITGHTDSVASDAYNLELSQRRAAAVKQALVTRYGVSGDRLQTDGRGEGSPKDTNDTLEGRARNRRVELVRLR